MNSSMKTNVVLSITECDGHIWIGTDGYGIFILNPENEEMVSLEHVPGNRNLVTDKLHSLPIQRISITTYGQAAYGVD